MNYNYLPPLKSTQSSMCPSFVQLKASSQTRHLPLYPMNADWEMVVEPENILGHRWLKASGIPNLELLVQWHNRPLEEASWEEYDLLVTQFPKFRLEDKVTFQGGCTDTTPPLRTYFGRPRGTLLAAKSQIEFDSVPDPVEKIVAEIKGGLIP